MNIYTPEWLTRRGGDLRRASDGQTYFALVNGKPLYRLTPVPASGKFSCVIVQTNNGNRLPTEGVYDTKEDAIRGGLEELGSVLGWR